MSFSADARADPVALVAHSVAEMTALLRAEHEQATGPLQRAVDRITGVVGRPACVVLLALATVAWAAGNLVAERVGYVPVDGPPFPWLGGAASIGALLVAALILTTQRREDQLANHRALLVLELSILNDQKIAKIVELLEEVRRDNPNPAISDRIDELAAAMSAPSDTRGVLEAIKLIDDPLE